MGMFDEMKKRDNYNKEIIKGSITLNFEQTNEGIHLTAEIDANKMMIIEGVLTLLEAAVEAGITQQDFILAKLMRGVQK